MATEDVASADVAVAVCGGGGGEAKGHRRGRGHRTTAVVPAWTWRYGRPHATLPWTWSLGQLRGNVAAAAAESVGRGRDARGRHRLRGSGCEDGREHCRCGQGGRGGWGGASLRMRGCRGGSRIKRMRLLNCCVATAASDAARCACKLLQGSFCSAVMCHRNLFASVDAAGATVDIHTLSCTLLVQVNWNLSVLTKSLWTRTKQFPHFWLANQGRRTLLQQ